MKKFQWDKTRFYDDVVYKAFKHKASRHLINILAKARQASKDKLERDPTPKEIFLTYYTKDGTCTGKKVEEVVEAFDKLLYQAIELGASEESPNVDMSLLWMDAVGGPKNGNILGMGSEARDVLQRVKHVLNSLLPSFQDSGENLHEEMRASIQEVREDITTNNQHWEKMFEQLIQGHNALAQKMNSLVKKKGPNGK